MPYRNQSVGRNRDKDKKLFRESSKKRYESEKREMEKELHENRVEMEKLSNEDFEYYDTRIEHGAHYAIFKKKGEEIFKELKFEYEENYSHMQNEWTVSE